MDPKTRELLDATTTVRQAYDNDAIAKATREQARIKLEQSQAAQYKLNELAKEREHLIEMERMRQQHEIEMAQIKNGSYLKAKIENTSRIHLSGSQDLKTKSISDQAQAIKSELSHAEEGFPSIASGDLMKMLESEEEFKSLPSNLSHTVESYIQNNRSASSKISHFIKTNPKATIAAILVAAGVVSSIGAAIALISKKP